MLVEPSLNPPLGMVLQHLPPTCQWDRSTVQRDLCSLLHTAAQQWPPFDVPLSGFIAHLATILPLHSRNPLAELPCPHDLYLAWACTQGDEQASALLWDQYLIPLKPALAKYKLDPVDGDEIMQHTAVMLLIGGEKGPKLASYAGRSPLAHWLRVVFNREALLFLRRQGRHCYGDAELLQKVPGAGGPELSVLKHFSEELFSQAFLKALAELDSDARLLLRQRFIDGASIDKLAVLHQLHRATCARRLVAIQQQLQKRIFQILKRERRLSQSDIESLVAYIRSRFNVSLCQALQ